MISSGGAHRLATLEAKAMAALHNLPIGDRDLHVAFQTLHKQ